ncbi:MAG: 30S ribosomal protein S20 [Myxococcales bacterium]|nr:30S ribosomal protein S20 [Myxococcales bacterium]
MANHSSADKRNRQRIKRTLRNRSAKTAVRGVVKQVRAALANGDKNAASTALATATSALDSAVTKGVMHRKTASRSISRLTKAVEAAKKA